MRAARLCGARTWDVRISCIWDARAGGRSSDKQRGGRLRGLPEERGDASEFDPVEQV